MTLQELKEKLQGHQQIKEISLGSSIFIHGGIVFKGGPRVPQPLAKFKICTIYEAPPGYIINIEGCERLCSPDLFALDTPLLQIDTKYSFVSLYDPRLMLVAHKGSLLEMMTHHKEDKPCTHLVFDVVQAPREEISMEIVITDSDSLDNEEMIWTVNYKRNTGVV